MRGRAVAFYVGSIIASRAIYGLNWYNLAPLYLSIGRELSLSLAYLGLIPSFFLAGAALFQLPAGALAARYGAKRVAMWGMYILGAFTLLSGLAWGLVPLLAFRFMVGVGAALYFSTSIRLLRDYFGLGRSGLALGLYNAAFNLGAGIGVLGWAFVASLIGWRASLLAAGLAALLITVENDAVLPADTTNGATSLRTAIRRDVVLLGVALSGFWAAYYSASQYLHSYLVLRGTLGERDSAIVSSLVLFAGCLGGPLLGHLSDRAGGRKKLLYLLTPLLSALIALTPLYRAWSVWLYGALLGLLSGGIFSIMYSLPSENRDIAAGALPFALGLVNAIQIAAGSAIALLFPLVASLSSFDVAWASLAFVALLFLALLRGVNERGRA
jgi:MFS family permease